MLTNIYIYIYIYIHIHISVYVTYKDCFFNIVFNNKKNQLSFPRNK